MIKNSSLIENFDKTGKDFINYCLNICLKRIKHYLKNNDLNKLKKESDLIFFFDKIESENIFEIVFDLEKIKNFLGLESKIDCIIISLLLYSIYKTIIENTINNKIIKSEISLNKNNIINSFLLNNHLKKLFIDCDEFSL